MDSIEGGGSRSSLNTQEPDVDTLQFREEIQQLMAVPPENASSFTALLELPETQAVALLNSPESAQSPAVTPTYNNPDNDDSQKKPYILDNLMFPALIERAARFSVFAGENLERTVKKEPAEIESYPNFLRPLVYECTAEEKSPNQARRSVKRKEREKKGKVSPKKCKSAANESSNDAEKLPYVHVRARRGQATDSHSLAERARREKINARMKLLQELVPGCNRITGTASVLDEIINHVQSLQRQVEFLSMRLAAVNPRTDFNIDSLLTAESGSPMDSNFPNMVMPLMFPEGQLNENRQPYQPQWHFDAPHPVGWGREEECHNFINFDNSLLTYNSSANSASLHTNQLKMEL